MSSCETIKLTGTYVVKFLAMNSMVFQKSRYSKKHISGSTKLFHAHENYNMNTLKYTFNQQGSTSPQALI